MRMWLVSPKKLCRKHLLGEHGELHKHRHVFVKKWSIKNRVLENNVQIEPESMKKRHDELVKEMLRRGYNHNSPYEQPNLDYLSNRERFTKVDLHKSIIDLCKRCEECKKLLKG